MKRRTQELGLVGLVGLAGYVLGEHRHRRHHVPRDLALLFLFGAVVIAVVINLLVALWPYVLGIGAVVAVLFIAHHRRKEGRQEELHRAYAEGFTQGQREAQHVERSWGRSVPAYDKDDPDSF